MIVPVATGCFDISKLKSMGNATIDYWLERKNIMNQAMLNHINRERISRGRTTLSMKQATSDTICQGRDRFVGFDKVAFLIGYGYEAPRDHISHDHLAEVNRLRREKNQAALTMQQAQSALASRPHHSTTNNYGNDFLLFYLVGLTTANLMLSESHRHSGADPAPSFEPSTSYDPAPSVDTGSSYDSGSSGGSDSGSFSGGGDP